MTLVTCSERLENIHHIAVFIMRAVFTEKGSIQPFLEKMGPIRAVFDSKWPYLIFLKNISN